MKQFNEPNNIESLLGRSPLVKYCMVVGYDQTYLSALVAPDIAALSDMLRQDNPSHEYNLESYRGLNHIDVRSYFCDLIEEVNRIGGGKRIERFALIEGNADQGRDVLREGNKRIIESFYQEYIPGIG